MPPRPSFLSKLAKGIHPPLLTTPKDSERLLGLLHESFRKQLDKEHPSSRCERGGPLDSHLNAIVTSPLFNKSTNPTAAKQESLLVQDPYHYFEHAIATGNATLSVAKECLLFCPKRCSTTRSRASTEQALLVRSIDRWLWSSGLKESMEFCYDAEFLDLFLKNMEPEPRLYKATEWYRSLISMTVESFHMSSKSHKKLLKPMSILFRTLVLRHGSNADGTTLLEPMMKEFIEMSQSINNALPHYVRASISRDTTNRLVRMLLQHDTANETDAGTYDEFCISIKENGCATKWVPSICELKHPSNPSASKAIHYLNTLSPESVQDIRSIERGWAIALLDETIKYLLAIGEVKKAQSILDYTQMILSNKEHTHCGFRPESFQPANHAASV